MCDVKCIHWNEYTRWCDLFSANCDGPEDCIEYEPEDEWEEDFQEF